ncbi:MULTISPECIES: sterol desaturase family protein [unclassified Rhizobium]|uniref:sterol desaturase family protein n=1 Tax=unclassified Rhizobium TaxID=2613769 RepID=UPI000715DDC3|nr:MULTISPECIES: sterol desaturase family protein [unclassified Rhizobium]KQS96722.1 fatty acid hydroxylase [Rhizobium sp. Leaf386]KQU10349.1 fatty acid hydroxylase [Rhizobium sp. Leaf453]
MAVEIFGISEPVWRLFCFATIFLALALLELLHPRLERPELMRALKARRWFTNLSILVLSSLMLRIVFPAAATGVALWGEIHGYGLLPIVGLPPLIAGALAFVILDFTVWLEHLLSHKVPVLWRIHRVHHSDTGLDLTTALRFHPLEILLSMLWKSAVILLIGAPAVSVLIFEIVLNGAAMFNHANIKLPARLDHMLRRLVVTPDMHSVHHSSQPDETDSNYGFNLSLWDRLFATYRAQSRQAPEDMRIGLDSYRNPLPQRLVWSLLLPFRPRDTDRLQ